MTASVPKRVGPFESPLTAWAGPYMSLFTDAVSGCSVAQGCFDDPHMQDRFLLLRYLIPTTIASGPTRGSTRVSRNPTSCSHPQQSAPV